VRVEGCSSDVEEERGCVMGSTLLSSTGMVGCERRFLGRLCGAMDVLGGGMVGCSKVVLSEMGGTLSRGEASPCICCKWFTG